MSEAIAPAACRRARRAPPLSFVAGVVLLMVFLLAAVAPELLSPADPLKIDYLSILKPPSAAHWFGTDNLGRDILARTIHAARIDLQIALFATIPSVVIGTVVGAYVGYRGGIADAVFGQAVNLVITFPFLVLVIAIIAVLGPGLVNMYIAIGSVGWVFYGRITRAEILVQREQDYAKAGRVLGYTHARILFRHLLPNAATPILTYWMTDMALAILLGSSLGYLGLGAQPPTAEWGVLIADGKNFMSTAWWMSVFPGIAIIVAGLGFSLAGDGVADWLRPKR